MSALTARPPLQVRSATSQELRLDADAMQNTAVDDAVAVMSRVTVDRSTSSKPSADHTNSATGRTQRQAGVLEHDAAGVRRRRARRARRRRPAHRAAPTHLPAQPSAGRSAAPDERTSTLPRPAASAQRPREPREPPPARPLRRYVPSAPPGRTATPRRHRRPVAHDGPTHDGPEAHPAGRACAQAIRQADDGLSARGRGSRALSPGHRGQRRQSRSRRSQDRTPAV